MTRARTTIAATTVMTEVDHARIVLFRIVPSSHTIGLGFASAGLFQMIAPNANLRVFRDV